MLCSLLGRIHGIDRPADTNPGVLVWKLLGDGSSVAWPGTHRSTQGGDCPERSPHGRSAAGLGSRKRGLGGGPRTLTERDCSKCTRAGRVYGPAMDDAQSLAPNCSWPDRGRRGSKPRQPVWSLAPPGSLSPRECCHRLRTIVCRG